MTPGFVRPYPLFECPTLDGQNWELKGPLWYISKNGSIYCIPALSTTDGPSIPPTVLSIISPFGPIWGPSILHDSGFRGTLLIWNTATQRLVPANHNMATLDALFDEAMEVYGMDPNARRIVFGAVERFGEPSFVSDLSQSIPNILVPKELPPEVIAMAA